MLGNMVFINLISLIGRNFIFIKIRAILRRLDNLLVFQYLMAYILKILLQKQIISKLDIDLIILENIYIPILIDILKKLIIIRLLKHLLGFIRDF